MRAVRMLLLLELQAVAADPTVLVGSSQFLRGGRPEEQHDGAVQNTPVLAIEANVGGVEILPLGVENARARDENVEVASMQDSDVETRKQNAKLAFIALCVSPVALLFSVLAIGLLCRLLGAAKQLEMIELTQASRAAKAPQRAPKIEVQGPSAQRGARRSSLGGAGYSDEQSGAAAAPKTAQHRISRHFEASPGNSGKAVAAAPAPETEPSPTADVAVQSRTTLPLYTQLQPPEKGKPQDFWVFVKKYEWALYYRIQCNADGSVRRELPLEYLWVNLVKKLEGPEELQAIAGDRELLDWSKTAPSGYSGFNYTVHEEKGGKQRAADVDPQAAPEPQRVSINLLKQGGPELLLSADGCRLGKTPKGAIGAPVKDDAPALVTHCWVEVVGMPIFPRTKSLLFFCGDELVWKGGQR